MLMRDYAMPLMMPLPRYVLSIIDADDFISMLAATLMILMRDVCLMLDAAARRFRHVHANDALFDAAA